QTLWNSLPEQERNHITHYRRVISFESGVGQIDALIDRPTKATERIYEAIHTLYTLEFRFDVMEDVRNGSTTWTKHSRLISQYEKPNDGSGRVRWEFAPDILVQVVDPHQWAEINPRLTNAFKSKYANTLYYNTVRYLKNPSGLTAKRSVEDWIRLLVPSPKTAERFLRPGMYPAFKSEHLNEAMRELAEKDDCPFYLELIEDTTSRRKVVALQFRLHKKSRQIKD